MKTNLTFKEFGTKLKKNQKVQRPNNIINGGI